MSVFRSVLLAALATVALGSDVAVAAAPGTTFLASRPDGFGPAPSAPDNDSGRPVAVSPDGRYVVFASQADGFAAGVDPRFSNIFLRDTATDTTQVVSRSDGAAGAPSNAGAEGLRAAVAVVPGAVAADAPHDRPHVVVVFDSKATNLVDHATGTVPVTNGTEQVWLRDVTAGTTTLISRGDGAQGAAGNAQSRQPSLATGPHGPVVAFTSVATNIGSVNPGHVYVRDVGAGATRLVSCPGRSCGQPSANNGFGSGDPSVAVVPGSDFTPCPAGAPCVLVAFDTQDATLSFDATGHSQVLVGRAVLTATGLQTFSAWTVASLRNAHPDEFGNGESQAPALAADGLSVAFASEATNLRGAGPPPTGDRDVFVHRLDADATSLASPGVAGPAEDVTLGGTFPNLRVGFSSFSDDLGTPQPFTRLAHAYVSSYPAITISLIDRATGGAVADGNSSVPQISADGSTAAFASRAGNLGGGTEFGRVYRRVLAGGPTTLVSRPDGTGLSSTGSHRAQITARAISADGRYIAFDSREDDLSGEDDDRFVNVFVRDALTGSTTLVSRADGRAGAPADADSRAVGISDDGRRVLFDTSARDLPGPANQPRAFVRDLDAGTTVVATRANGPTGTVAGGRSLSLSGDGNRVAFASGNSLDPDASNAVVSLYVRDLAAGTTTFVSRDDGAAGRAAEDPPEEASLDRDGGRVAWSTSALLPGAGSSSVTRERVFVRDLAAGRTLLVSRATGASGAENDRAASHPSIDAAGDAVAFESGATTLGAPVGNVAVWVRHLDSLRTDLASRATGAAGALPDGNATGASLAAAGDRVAFISHASNLGGGSLTAINDQLAYVRDLGAGTTELVSRADGPGGAPADPPTSGAISLSANGNCAAFAVSALNLRDGFDSADFSAIHVRALRGDCPLGPLAGSPTPSPGAPPSASEGSPPLPQGQKPPAPLSPRRPAVLSRLTLKPGRFHVVGRKGGTSIRFQLSRASRVTLTFARLTTGRLSGTHCRAKAQKGKRCTITVSVGGVPARNARAGANTVRFAGRLRNKALRPGRYRVTARPTGGVARTARFTVVRGPARTTPTRSAHSR